VFLSIQPLISWIIGEAQLFILLPGAGGGNKARPVVTVKTERLPETGLAGMVDSGELHNRFDESYASLAGIDLEYAEAESSFKIAE
jgi:hypothetical protein